MKIEENIFPYIIKNVTNLISKNSLVSRSIVEIVDSKLVVTGTGERCMFDLDEISLLNTSGTWYTTIKIVHAKQELECGYLDGKKAEAFVAQFERKKQWYIDKKVADERRLKQLKEDREIVDNAKGEIFQVINDIQALSELDTFFSVDMEEKVRLILQDCFEPLRLYQQFDNLPSGYKKALDQLSNLTQTLESWVQRRNSQFEKCRIESDDFYFENLEEHPLTPEQRKACVVDDNWNLVLASAGSGKTSVISGKVGLLLKHGEVKPEEIVMLSFAKDASKEITERIKENIVQNKKVTFDWAAGLNMEASTFHKLGKSIIEQSCRKLQEDPPKVYSQSEEDSATSIKHHLISMLNDEGELARLVVYLASHQKPNKSQLEYSSYQEYVEDAKANNLLTLQNENVKSFEEFNIANYLYLSGIPYTYEKEYERDISVVGWSRGYKPDFTIQWEGKTIYLEHYGISKDEKAPKWFKSPDEYVQKMKEKRIIHQKNQTDLVESYSYQMSQGTLELNLKIALGKRGVVFSEKSARDALNNLEDHASLKELSRLLFKFLNQFKQSQLSLDELWFKKLKNLKDSKRARAFYEVFEVVYRKYSNELEKQGKIDFNDMINRAVQYIEGKVYKPMFKRVLVDEFQDISKARMRLVEALASYGPEDTRVFCVGHDFQAIYAFTGCDIAFIKYFDKYFGERAQKRSLFTTFRYNNKIGEVAKHFIEKNQFQEVKPNNVFGDSIDHPTVSLLKTPEEDRIPITFAMKQIIEKSGLDNDVNKDISVLVLTRYKKDKDDNAEAEIRARLAPYKKAYPNLEIQVMTTHKSKGQGKDYVIIIDLFKGGFPCETVNDPLLDVIQKGDDTYGVETYPDAEERRLFYVALTRAKKRVYMVVQPPKVSKFIIELIADKCDIEVLEDDQDYDSDRHYNPTICTVKCPSCDVGYLERRTSWLHTCSHSPVCDAQFDTCPACEAGVVLYDKGSNKYVCSECKIPYFSCGDCDSGWLTPRAKKAGGVFLRCKLYYVQEVRCKGGSRRLGGEKMESELQKSFDASGKDCHFEGYRYWLNNYHNASEKNT